LPFFCSRSHLPCPLVPETSFPWSWTARRSVRCYIRVFLMAEDAKPYQIWSVRITITHKTKDHSGNFVTSCAILANMQ